MEMETNSSSDKTEARQASINVVDNLLSEAIEQVDMDTYYNNKDLEFFEKVFETKPAFSPGSEAHSECDLSPPASPGTPTQFSPGPLQTKRPPSPGSVSSSDSSFVFSASPILSPVTNQKAPRPSPVDPAMSPAASPAASPAVSPAVSGYLPPPRQISSPGLARLMTGDLLVKRFPPSSPGLDLQPTQASAATQLPPNKKLKLSGREQDVNANITEDSAEIMEDLEVGEMERYNLIRMLAEKFLLAVPSVHSRVSLKPAGDCSPVAETAPGEVLGEKVSPELLNNNRTSSSLQPLNHRAPRVGLSKLEKKVMNLHQISTSGKEE